VGGGRENRGAGSETACDFRDWLLRETGPTITIRLDGALGREAARERQRKEALEHLSAALQARRRDSSDDDTLS